MIGDDEGEAFDQAMRKAMAGIPDPVDSVEPKRKRRSSTSPTARTLAECRKRKLIVQVVERYNPHARVRVDLFGVIDLVAIVPGPVAAEHRIETPTGPVARWPAGILGIQACAGASHADRRDKILAEPRARAWVYAGGQLELWSWAKQGARGKAKRWTLRVEAFTAASWEAELPPAFRLPGGP